MVGNIVSWRDRKNWELFGGAEEIFVDNVDICPSKKKKVNRMIFPSLVNWYEAKEICNR